MRLWLGKTLHLHEQLIDKSCRLFSSPYRKEEAVRQRVFLSIINIFEINIDAYVFSNGVKKIYLSPADDPL